MPWQAYTKCLAIGDSPSISKRLTQGPHIGTRTLFPGLLVCGPTHRDMYSLTPTCICYCAEGGTIHPPLFPASELSACLANSTTCPVDPISNQCYMIQGHIDLFPHVSFLSGPDLLIVRVSSHLPLKLQRYSLSWTLSPIPSPLAHWHQSSRSTTDGDGPQALTCTRCKEREEGNSPAWETEPEAPPSFCPKISHPSLLALPAAHIDMRSYGPQHLIPPHTQSCYSSPGRKALSWLSLCTSPAGVAPASTESALDGGGIPPMNVLSGPFLLGLRLNGASPSRWSDHPLCLSSPPGRTQRSPPSSPLLPSTCSHAPLK